MAEGQGFKTSQEGWQVEAQNYDWYPCIPQYGMGDDKAVSGGNCWQRGIVFEDLAEDGE